MNNLNFISSKFNNSNNSNNFNNKHINSSNSNTIPASFNTYIITILAAYFLTKIIYPFFYKLNPTILPTEELTNLTTTLTLSSIAYLLSNLTSMPIHWLFYLGIIAGINYPALYHHILSPTTHTTLSSQNTQRFFNSIIYFKIIALFLLLLYAGITSNQIESYILYLSGYLILLIGLLYSKRNTTHNTKIINFGLSFTSWILVLIFIFPKNQPILTIFLQLFFGFILGSFIGNMSYQGPDYIIQNTTSKKQNKTEITITSDDNTLITIKWILTITVFFNLLLFILYFLKST